MVTQQLEGAIGTGEIVRIAYAGGSQPGSERDIYPLEVKGSKVRAKCIASGVVKMFDIAKISIVRLVAPGPTPPVTYDPSTPAVQQFQSFEHVAAELAPSLSRMGWQMDQEADGENRVLSLHSFFKNGKLRKTPDVTLHFTPREPIKDYTLVVSIDPKPLGVTTQAREETQQTATRPWSVRSKAMASGKAYGKIDRAVQVFLEQAEKLAPNAIS